MMIDVTTLPCPSAPFSGGHHLLGPSELDLQLVPGRRCRFCHKWESQLAESAKEPASCE